MFQPEGGYRNPGPNDDRVLIVLAGLVVAFLFVTIGLTWLMNRPEEPQVRHVVGELPVSQIPTATIERAK